MFKLRQLTVVNDYKCNHCNYKHNEINQTSKNIFTNNNYLIINIYSSHNNTYIDTKIKNFNPDIVELPNSSHQFRVTAAIVFQPFNENIMNGGGHYICWQRIKNNFGWNKISDTSGEYSKDFLKNLDGVYLLFLEKI